MKAWRAGLALVVATLLLVALERWVDRAAAPAPAPVSRVTAPAAEVGRPLAPTEVLDRDADLVVADALERRARFEGLRDAFRGAGAPSSASKRRLDAALAAAGPDRAVRWTSLCRASVCQVIGERTWIAAVIDSPGVQRVVDRVALDPGGADPAAYVLLLPERAAAGYDLLSAIERELVESEEARRCGTSEGVMGTISFELRVDASGFTYRTRSELPPGVVDCVTAVLGDLFRLTPIPQGGVKSSARTVVLRWT